MKVIVLFRPNSDHERSVINFDRDFQQVTGRRPELRSLETVLGAETAKLYDITQYPAIIATTDDGLLRQLWQGERLPLISDVAGYSR